MLSIILFLLVISSFAVFACFRFDRTFEEVLPISCMGTLLILFIFGMLNILRVGAIFVCAISALLYLYTIVVAVRKKTFVNLFTSGFFVFTIMSALLVYWNKDRLAMISDEFSHWLDTVVIMTRIDAFGTAPDSTAVFPSYPPAMSLLQYLMEKLEMIGGGEFSEWRAYYVYQLFAVAIMLPFIRVVNGDWSKKLASVITWFMALVAPLYFFSNAYNSLYIDPILGVMAGCGFAMISLSKKKDWVYVTYVTMLCAVLTLTKDVGIYLAIFISLYYLIDKKKLLGFLPMAAMIVAKLLWKLELTVSHTVQKFSAPFDIKGTFDTINGHGSDYYTAVYNNFLGAITSRQVLYERAGVNYVSMMLLLAICFGLFHFKLYKKSRITRGTAIAGTILPSVAVTAYILSMFPLYISRFVEEEALNLASFDRYCGIVFLTGVLFVIWLFRDMLLSWDKKYLLVLVSLVIILSVFHSQRIALTNYVTRGSVKTSNDYRAGVNILSAKINAYTDEDATILLIGYDEDQMMHPILETISKPRKFAFNQDFSAEEYDYVAIYRPTEDMEQDYGLKFADSQDIDILTLYVVDAEGLLRIVQ